MKNRISFGTWEASALTINMICTKIFLNFPRKVAEDAGTAGWILTIYISIISLLLFYIISKLHRKFERLDLIDISEKSFGSIGRIIAGVVFLIPLIYIVSVVLREFSEDMKIISLTLTPISLVTVLFSIAIIIGAYLGIEPIVRVQAFLVPIIIVAYFIIIFGVAPHFELSRIMPILGTGASDIFIKGASKISIFGELLILFLIIPFLKSNKEFSKVGYISIGASAFFLTIGSLAYLLVYSYPTALENFLPIYQLTRIIDLGRFFERVESLFLIFWAIAALLYLSTGVFFITYVFQKTFKLKYQRPLIFPMMIIIFNLSLLPENLYMSVIYETRYFRDMAWIVTFLIPIIILIFARILNKNKKVRKNV